MIKVDRQDLLFVTGRLKRYSNLLNSAESYQVSLAGGRDVVSALRQSVYKNEKIRVYDGSRGGKRRFTVYPGNLAKSFASYRSKRFSPPGKWAVEVGPKFLRNAPPEMGKTIRSASGYYAAAMAGTAALFRINFMEPIAATVAPEAITAMSNKLSEIHTRFWR